MLTYALIAGAICIICCGLTALFIYASSVVSNSYFEKPEHYGDHEHSLSVARARRREADAARAAGGAVPAVPTREPGPRDPTIGVDQARAEVRARIHRYNRREVRR